ncbi:uncharacterized protein LOC130897881 [Diorhabda carinulata]|uniref:uncharacterized protein LOC130897881 n=1 Tax=Diorhabda carinulata TaxID=1163345 RepID=UPI0025A1C448|nr:uncharacterized protein LOC130897881 [Diorhabda carinulata]
MMADKAVSTEDLWVEEEKISVAVSLIRLESILQTLLDNKVKALRNENRNTSSIHSSRKSILKRLRLMSTSSQSTIKEENGKGKALKKDSSISSSTLQACQCRTPNFEVPSVNERDKDNIHAKKCPTNTNRSTNCCCDHELEEHTLRYDEHYISLGVDPEKPSPLDDILAEEALYRARKKRRKRRKKLMKKRMAMAQNACYMEEGELNESYKHLTVDESSRRAKWTIVATAFLLLFMCLLLVGLTLRMAPIIDEMVRKENEEFVNSLTRHRNSSAAHSVQMNHT